jgi:cytochrome c-type biogenesis protein CcmH
VRRLASLLALLACLSMAPATQAATSPDEILADPVLEQRARDLSKQLRCLVCQNQSIDDSDAPLARDLRILIRERLEAGDSDREVFDYLVARYGEFVLMRPRFSAMNLVLWLTPALALILGAVLAVRRFRARPEPAGAADLRAEEEEALARILEREK